MNLHPAHTLRNASLEPELRACREITHVDTLRGFPELVRQLGGNPNELLRQAGIDPAVLSVPGSAIDYRSRLHLMECAARELSCLDFGLRLGAMQSGQPAVGPIGVVMRNCNTLGQAIDYWAAHNYAYTRATRMHLEPDRLKHQLVIRVEFLLEGVPNRRQGMEHALMLAALNIVKMTGGAARVRKILFSHEPHSSLRTYRTYFGCGVGFGEKSDGLILDETDLLCPVVNADPTVYEMARSFIEDRFPQTEPPIRVRVRGLILQYLGTKDCTIERVAAELYLHQRTLQRRLRAEGVSFESIKDELRREVALRYISEDGMSLKRLAEMLGYAETSIVSRSFNRWFSATPRQLIVRLKSDFTAYRGI
jgi:AraC-like DNA-binding protein